MSDREKYTTKHQGVNEIGDITERMDDVRERLKQLTEFLNRKSVVNSSFDGSAYRDAINDDVHSLKDVTCNDNYSDTCSNKVPFDVISNNSSKRHNLKYFGAENISQEHSTVASYSRTLSKELDLPMPKRKVVLQPQRRRCAWHEDRGSSTKTFTPTSHQLHKQTFMPYEENENSVSELQEQEEHKRKQEEEKELEEKEKQEEYEVKEKNELSAQVVCVEENNEKLEKSNNTDNPKQQEEKLGSEKTSEKLWQSDNTTIEVQVENMPSNSDLKFSTASSFAASSSTARHSEEEKSVNTTEQIEASCVEQETEQNAIMDNKIYSSTKEKKLMQTNYDDIEYKENQPPLFLTRNLSGLYANNQTFDLMEAVQKRLQRKQQTSMPPLTEKQSKLTLPYRSSIIPAEKKFNESASNNANVNTEPNEEKRSNQLYVKSEQNTNDSYEQSPESPARSCSTETAAPESSPVQALLQVENLHNEEFEENYEEELLQEEITYEPTECVVCENNTPWNNKNDNDKCSMAHVQSLTSPLHDATIKITVTLHELLSLLEMRQWLQTSASDSAKSITHDINKSNNRPYTLFVTSQEHAMLLLQRSALHTQRSKAKNNALTERNITESEDDKENYSNDDASTENTYECRHSSTNVNNIRRNSTSTLHKMKTGLCTSICTNTNRECGKQKHSRIPVWREASTALR